MQRCSNRGLKDKSADKIVPTTSTIFSLIQCSYSVYIILPQFSVAFYTGAKTNRARILAEQTTPSPSTTPLPPSKLQARRRINIRGKSVFRSHPVFFVLAHRCYCRSCEASYRCLLFDASHPLSPYTGGSRDAWLHLVYILLARCSIPAKHN